MSKERGMIFNAEMVRALLSGSKMQTRRPIKPQPELTERSGFSWKDRVYGSGSSDPETNRNFAHVACPHGKPGDRIWVRETWNKYSGLLTYRADYDWIDEMRQVAVCTAKWTPSIHMPRWASRITLEITDVRVERLQAITVADALDEGIEHRTMNCPRHEYFQLWNSIYGDMQHESNPWVWVIEFKRVQECAA